MSEHSTIDTGTGRHEYLAQGGDWDEIVSENAERGDETIVINFGPSHPSTHGVMRLIMELDGETVTKVRPGIGFLHTGIEKNMEYRTWTQGVTFMTRCNYVANFFNEAVYCLAVEKLLGITDQIPERASILRVMIMEINRISSHLVAIGTGGLELGATSVAEVGLREREICLEFNQAVTGLRMNNAWIRPGGTATDLPENGLDMLRDLIKRMEDNIPEIDQFFTANPIFRSRTRGVGYMDLSGCMAMGATGPVLRSTGLPWDLRRKQPYCGYETYDFDVQTADTCDAYGRYKVRLGELFESVKILKQCLERLKDTQGQPHMVADKKIAWPAELAIGPDGQGNSNEHIKHIMGESMEALIHHFKIVTEGFAVPAGQVYQTVEGAGGELGCHLVSDGGVRPYRSHLRDPGFIHVQSIPAMTEGAMLSDVVVVLASLDPVLGGVDR
ncbi:MAG: NADH-quinone oxidoreductase subunit D [Acidipropionibacterium acidipropionici]|jgi:NADH-quinone oxidoreductase subunit D|uniref:NADH-quinone oxidoreductase subunit D n=2 Tax=Acidipropionibacterium acidipropionici TaxID=1748 RepID=A0A142KG96_9ACTN|nr:NADH-quinone oxidoreductase subunit D [Acidipropionibacterium acidipropionici]AFV90410.1 NADH-quinone oxidoreductase subunit D [Acidipropionibacterium acidipropionici ATCC 4875]ALN15361.1 NADH dehydrogenase [Acidipropionibacterium acidipropionici]AMS05134.1 NADH dehydrogenase [Acidipropionibacterium acidipropionici]AOZ46617.1 NADH dehydrogenase subunit D [Acidipropionibacterium acidipropionici]APZ08896.1 NADH dehydrogenase subunit D [Acidipropionibacterium acidipropionici]